MCRGGSQSKFHQFGTHFDDRFLGLTTKLRPLESFLTYLTSLYY